MKPIQNRPSITSGKVNGNSATFSLLRKVPGATKYDFYVLYEDAAQEDRPAYQGRYVRKISTKNTSVTMHNLPKGNWKIACLANITSKTDKWSNELTFQIKQDPVAKPVLKKAVVNGRNVTVTIAQPKNSKGYDCVLSRGWEKQPYESVYVKKNQNSSVITFKNVKPGIYYAGAHAFVRQNINSGAKVFGQWSNTKKITVI